MAEKKPRSPLLPIFLIVVVDILGLTIILPLLPFYSEHFGASPFVVGLLVSSYAVCQLVAGPALGALSDQIGRKPVLLVSQLGTFIGFLILGFSQALWMVFLSRIIDGLTAGNISIAQAYISDVTEPKNRAKSFGVIGIAFGLGFLVGPAVSGFLSQFGYHYPVFLAAALSMTSILTTWFMLPAKSKVAHAGEIHRPRTQLFQWAQYRRYFESPLLSNLLLEFFLFCFAFGLFNSGFSLFAERRLTWHGLPFGPKEVGYVYAYAGFLGIIAQARLLGKLVERFGERRLAMFSLVSCIFGYGLMGFAHGVGFVILAITFHSFGSGFLRPALTSLISRSVSAREQGLILGLNQSLQSIGQIIAPICGGYLIEHGWLTGWGLLGSATSVLGLVLFKKKTEAGSHHHMAGAV